MPSELSLAVVGAAHANADGSNRRFEILLCAPREPVDLHPEPRNKADPNAIAVFSSRGIQIGYLRADRAPRIGQLIRQGRELQAAFQAEAPFGAWIRVAFDGEAPVLPDPIAAPAAEQETDGYPDEVWPDE